MQNCTIHYHDIGDYLTQEQKLELVKNSESINGIQDWQTIIPDKHYDWLDQRGGDFTRYLAMGDKDVKRGNGESAIFQTYSRGVATSRDPWAYNSSKSALTHNMTSTVDYCNEQDLDSPIINPKRAKWTGDLANKLKKISSAKFDKNKIRVAAYRPFFKQHLYFDSIFVSSLHLIPRFFPETASNTLAITVPYHADVQFSAIMTDVTPDIQINQNGQCFPLKSKQFINRSRDTRTQREPRENPERTQREPREIPERTQNSIRNLCIMVPYKIQGEFSVFMTDITPDLELVHHGQVFPFRVKMK